MSINASPASPVANGTTVTATAIAVGCPSPSYRFQLVDLSAGVGVVMQDWGEPNTWSWDTSGQQVGRYAIQIDAHGAGEGRFQVDVTAKVEVDIVRAVASSARLSGRCTAVTITVSPASAVVAGTAVTATATPSGCGAAEYRFQLVDLSTGVGLVMQDWGSPNSWTWDTHGQAAGRYAIRVDARGYGVASAQPDATSQVEVDVTH